MVRPASQHQHQGEDDESTHGENLSRRKPKLDFPEETNTEIVYKNDDDQKHSYEHTGVYSVPIDPVLNDQRTRRQLIRCRDDVLEPVCVPHTEA